MADGAPGKAVQSLLSAGIHSADDPSVHRTLVALHPTGIPVAWDELPGVLPLQADPSDLDWGELTRSAVRSFHRTSAGGPSGLRVSHLQDAIRRPGRGAPLVSALGSLASAWIQGKLPPDHGPVWCCATLLPLVKKDNGVRPVAIGEVLRRLVGKVLLALTEVRDQVSALAPVQVGVCVPAAAESVGMGVQAVVRRLVQNGSWACLQLDFSNAFNCLDRTAMLRAAAHTAPSVLNYLRFAYRTPAPLFTSGGVIMSSRGTHQGCPLGPLGFALGIHPIVTALQKEAGLIWSSWKLG